MKSFKELGLEFEFDQEIQQFRAFTNVNGKSISVIIGPKTMGGREGLFEMLLSLNEEEEDQLWETLGFSSQQGELTHEDLCKVFHFLESL